jgi:hypothetical protein
MYLHFSTCFKITDVFEHMHYDMNLDNLSTFNGEVHKYTPPPQHFILLSSLCSLIYASS